MPRISKDPEIRRTEFIQIAARLFREKGFANTAVEDIVSTAKVAKGTFYYYFKSKDEVLEAVVDYLAAQSLEVVGPVLAYESLGAVEKLQQMLTAFRRHYRKNSDIIEDMHAQGNDAFHLQSQIGAAKLISPVMAEILRQGVNEGVFRTDYPEAVSEILLLSSNLLLDDAIFPADDKCMMRRIQAIQHMAEKALDVPAGTLYFISKQEDFQ